MSHNGSPYSRNIITGALGLPPSQGPITANGIYSIAAASGVTGTSNVSDVTVNGRSLSEFMDTINQRMNYLKINPALEKEWDELKELGDLYRAKEKEIKDKAKVWGILKD
jgi:hypothetical protein